MKKKIIIDANFPGETRVALLDKNNNIEHIDFDSKETKQIRGNIYLAKITRIEPSLQAAFVDYGEDKSGFLPFSEINPSYYHAPLGTIDSSNISGDEIKTTDITSEDIKNKDQHNTINHLIEKDDISPEEIEKLIDEKKDSNFNIDAEDDEIEHISNNSSKNSAEKQYKIQEVLKKGQVMLVQVTKSERGNKGASLTTHISLAGKYCVLMPNKSSQNGISRKISSFEERKRLKNIVSSIVTSEDSTPYSIIIRTAGAGHSTLEIKKDYDYLARLWNKIREATIKSKAPCFIHQEDGIILKTIRDLFDKNVKEINVQGKDGLESCMKFINEIMPNKAKSIKEYKGKTPIFTKFGIEKQLIELYQPIVHLPSGGYIVINPTEALISIDVNSGKSTGERNVEETALKTNLEAAKAVAKQCKIRDLSGLLVIDFIDLNESKHRKILERSLWEFFSKDKARIQTAPISNFGLLEMSRQRLRPSFLESNSNMCSYCSGKGLVRAEESNAMLILRTIENEIFNSKVDIVNVYGGAQAIIYLLNNKRKDISFIENKHNISLNFNIDPNASSDSYSIEKIKSHNKNRVKAEEKPAIQDTLEIYNTASNSEESTHKRKIKKSSNKQENKKENTPQQEKEQEQDKLTISTEENNIAKSANNEEAKEEPKKSPRKRVPRNTKKRVQKKEKA